MIQDYVCKYDGHEDEPIQGFCVSLDCQSKYQWCAQCLTQKHQTHANECKSFNQIKQMIKNYSNIINDWIRNINDEFNKVQNQYKSVSKFLENEKKKMMELEQILNEKNYQTFSNDFHYVKQWKNISLTKIINDNIINMLQRIILFILQIHLLNQGNKSRKSKINLIIMLKEFYIRKTKSMILLYNAQMMQQRKMIQIVQLGVKKDVFYLCILNYMKIHDINKYEEAIKCLEKAIIIDPKLAEAYGMKGGCLILEIMFAQDRFIRKI